MNEIFGLVLSGFISVQEPVVIADQNKILIEQLEERLENQQNTVSFSDWILKAVIGAEAIGISFLIYFLKTGGMEDFLKISFASLRSKEDQIDGIFRRSSQLLNYMGFRTLYLKAASLKTFKDFLDRKQLILIYKKVEKEDKFFFITGLTNGVLKAFVLNGELKEELLKDPSKTPLDLFQRLPLSLFAEEKGEDEQIISFIIFLKQDPKDFQANPLLFTLFPNINKKFYFKESRICLEENDEEKS